MPSGCARVFVCVCVCVRVRVCVCVCARVRVRARVRACVSQRSFNGKIYPHFFTHHFFTHGAQHIFSNLPTSPTSALFELSVDARRPFLRSDVQFFLTVLQIGVIRCSGQRGP